MKATDFELYEVWDESLKQYVTRMRVKCNDEYTWAPVWTPVPVGPVEETDEWEGA